MHSLTMRSTTVSERHGSIADYCMLMSLVTLLRPLLLLLLLLRENDETQHVVAIEEEYPLILPLSMNAVPAVYVDGSTEGSFPVSSRTCNRPRLGSVAPQAAGRMHNGGDVDKTDNLTL